ncbi:Hypothetical predicted protein [Mytilus galloprovincialis]|uniref:Uncharacterized protein n=1 Tax=Mytilus galloprovincialis TaxID=29158 RepID=A0A8B6HLD9_MYTGA|nr:Hypothetical predicted protein [Mytilus galloprovincialis]
MYAVMCVELSIHFSDKQGGPRPIQPYKLIQSISALHYQTDLSLIVGHGADCSGLVTDMVVMDNGSMVMCLPRQDRLLICKIDGSQVDSIDVDEPWYVTVINRSTVAIIEYHTYCIEMYDINSKRKIKSKSPNRKQICSGITTLNNKLVVSDDYRQERQNS